MATARLWVMALIALVAVAALGAASGTDSDPMGRVAVEHYEGIQRVLWREREARIDEQTRRELLRVDPARTGLVGPEWTGIVTTAGSLEAKRASASPGWVLVYRRWFDELGLRPGDRVAINSSASFPALYLAARVAAQSMGLECRSVLSLTASNHGATLTTFDFHGMDQLLVERGLLDPCVAGVTPGGYLDAGADLDEEPRRRLLARLDRLEGTEVLLPASLEESRAFRTRLLLDQTPPGVYINIGGHATGYGTGARALAVPRGIVRPGGTPAGALPQSTLGDALDRGIPVINMLDVQGLLADEGLSATDGTLMPRLNTPIRGLAAILLAGLLMGGWMAGRPVSMTPTEGDLER